MFKRLLLTAVTLAVAALIDAPRVYAHGEAGDEPFLKDLTAAFYDVKIAPTQIQVGEPVTITGTVRILETWPYTLDPPQTAYVTPVVPGPVFALKERTINGQDAPGSFFVERAASTSSGWSSSEGIRGAGMCIPESRSRGRAP